MAAASPYFKVPVNDKYTERFASASAAAAPSEYGMSPGLCRASTYAQVSIKEPAAEAPVPIVAAAGGGYKAVTIAANVDSGASLASVAPIDAPVFNTHVANIVCTTPDIRTRITVT